MRISLFHPSKESVKKVVRRFLPMKMRNYLTKRKPTFVTYSAEDIAFEEFLRVSLDPQKYWAKHPDVASAGIDPCCHWLEFGIYERRELPEIETNFDEAFFSFLDPNWRRFKWRNQPIALKLQKPLSPMLLDQLMRQSRHDPAVLACGADALKNLRRFEAPNLRDRDGIIYKQILENIHVRPRVIVLIPFLATGGAEKYAADMVRAIIKFGKKTILTIVTEQTRKESKNWESIEILSPFKDTNILFWKDYFWRYGYDNPFILARLINSLKPEAVIVVNSHIGLDMVAHYGRGISQFAKIVCTFFSMGVNYIGAPYGAYFPRRTLKYATALTDNEPMADTLDRLYGGIPGPGIVLIPPCTKPVCEKKFSERLAKRREKISALCSSQRNWVWISRIEPFKGTAILAALAKKHVDDTFHVFGPYNGNSRELILDLPNIIINPSLDSVSDADLSQYDGFLFTSLFEGMPNTVLEVSQQAIPMVLADVGGLRATFDDNAAMFVSHKNNIADTVHGFSEALNKIRNLSIEQIIFMIDSARTQVLSRHTPEKYDQKVAKLFEAL